MRVSIVFLLCTALAFEVRAGNRWPKGPHELKVGLEVVYALEDGPVVCKVVLKNISNSELHYSSTMFSRGPFCTVDAAWRAKKKPLVQWCTVMGRTGPYIHTLQPGATDTKVFHLHKDYLSIPSGKATVRFGWNVYADKGDGGSRVGDPRHFKPIDEESRLETLFVLRETQVIDVRSATKENVTAVLRSLEKEFAKLPEGGHAGYGVGSEFVATLCDCRHKEFVPLLIRTIDSFGKPIRTVYDSFDNPEEGFETLLRYLASPQPATAADVFGYWWSEDHEHELKEKRQEAMKKPRVKVSATDKGRLLDSLVNADWHEEEVWRTSRRHLDTRLTAEKFARLLALPNVWVRALLYAHYPQQCPDEWVKALLRDLRSEVEPPRRLQELIVQLDADDFRRREQATNELLEIGLAWSPVLKAHKAKSPEVARRLERIVDKLSDKSLPRLCERTIAHLSSCTQPQNRQMLEILTSSTTPNMISSYARKALAEQTEWEERFRGTGNQKN